MNKMNKVKEINELGSSSSSLELLSLEPLEPLEQQYLNQLSQHELNAYLIAKNHLGTSFNLKKSNGYELWYKNLKPA